MNPSIAERESCPDCLVLERELTEAKIRLAALETELEATRNERDGWINQTCQHRERLDMLERENAELRKRIRELETHQPEAERTLPNPTLVHSTVVN